MSVSKMNFQDSSEPLYAHIDVSVIRRIQMKCLLSYWDFPFSGTYKRVWS